MVPRAISFLFILFFVSACTSTPSVPTSPATPEIIPEHSQTLQPTSHTNISSNTGWMMFHGEESHSGVAQGVGRIDSETGPDILAQYRLFDLPANEDDFARIRWTSTLPFADLDGDGQLEIIVTTPDVAAPTLVRLNGEPVPNMVQALKYTPGDPNLSVLWSYKLDSAPGEAGIDTYSPALGDANGDQLPDIIFTARDGYVRALSGKNGELIWKFNMESITEAGPMLSDLNGDGDLEVIVVTDCRIGMVECSKDGQASMYVLPLIAKDNNQPLWQFNYPFKMDSAEPVIANIHGLGKVILAGTWGGELLAVWRTDGGEIRSTSLKLSEIEPEFSYDAPPVIRTSPLIDYTPDGPMVIFGWLPSDQDATNGRLSAVRLRAEDGFLLLEHAWTISELDTWKSSPTLVPQADGRNLIVVGYGLGIGPPPTQSGTVGSCQSNYVFGGVAGINEEGRIVWNQSFGNEEGNLRASAAVADIDGDGRLEVVIPSGCYGDLHAFDAQSGTPEWTLELGPRTQTSPSIGDLDGDQNLEIVIASYNGLVYVLGAR